MLQGWKRYQTDPRSRLSAGLATLIFLVILVLFSSGCSSDDAGAGIQDLATANLTTGELATDFVAAPKHLTSEGANGFDVSENQTSADARGVKPVEPSPTAGLQQRDCIPQFPAYLELAYESLTDASMQISKAGFACAEEVGLAFSEDGAAIDALWERGVAGPLLLLEGVLSSDLATEIQRLDPQRIVVAGISKAVLQGALTNIEIDFLPVAQATQKPDVAPDVSNVPLPDEQLANLASATAQALPSSEPEDVGSLERTTQNTSQLPIEMELDPNQPTWLLGSPELEALVGVPAQHFDVSVVVGNEALVGSFAELQEKLSPASQIKVLWEKGSTFGWQIRTMQGDLQIPGGGLSMFETGVNRRLVAMYGHPSGSSLGVLGEQGIEAGIERLKTIAEGYADDDSVVLPTFEIIATVASAHPGADGDYSAETPRDDLRPWITAAAANDVYVVLDLQPGRTDYLTQAKLYEEFLRLPHVGLALDPEWRLKPNQVHLQQIGTVDAEEINHVVEWLAGIVREENLPQKLLILHQFSPKMITNPQLILTPPELAVLIHMDGQGPLQDKYHTWNLLTRHPAADRFYWGWKNFYDEDTPTPTPEQVMALSPKAVFVSYQ